MTTFFVLLLLGISNILNSGIEQYLVFSNPMTEPTIEVLDLYVYNLGIAQGDNIAMATLVGMLKTWQPCFQPLISAKYRAQTVLLRVQILLILHQTGFVPPSHGSLCPLRLQYQTGQTASRLEKFRVPRLSLFRGGHCKEARAWKAVFWYLGRRQRGSRVISLGWQWRLYPC